jgi:hypothetical protein
MWVRLIVRQEPVAGLIVDGRVAMGDRLAALFTAQAERVGALVSARGGVKVDLEFRGTRLSNCAHGVKSPSGPRAASKGP